MKIVSLQIENVKRIVAVEITPDGSLIVVGGKNAAGKSSVLDTVLAAFAGKKKLSPQMLRRGAKKGFVEVDLGDIVIRRTFTASGGGTLKVSNKEGAVFTSPQKMLDKLVGRISFDPLEFTRMDSKEQVELLKEITGLDFAALDAEREKLYERRTEVNRQGKQLSAQCEKMKKILPDKIPESEVSIAQLVKEFHHAQAINIKNNEIKKQLDTVSENIVQFNKQIADLQIQLKQAVKQQKTLKATVAQLEYADEDAISKQLESAEDNNRVFNLGCEYEKYSAELQRCRKKYTELTKSIKQIDQDKEDQLEQANMPVENLTFDENGVMLNSLPFEQASSAEQLRTSVEIGLAANPELKVLLIKDGSLLDEDNLKLIDEIAEKNDAQIWLERVGTGAEVTIILEDGYVK